MPRRRIHPEIAHLAVAIGTLTPHPRNARKRKTVDDLMDSLRLHGQYRPIVVNQRTGHIVGGNHLWKAAKALRWRDVAATFVDVDEETEIRLLLADNRYAELGGYDRPALDSLKDELKRTPLQLAGTGWELPDPERRTVSFQAKTTDPREACTHCGGTGKEPIE